MKCIGRSIEGGCAAVRPRAPPPAEAPRTPADALAHRHPGIEFVGCHRMKNAFFFISYPVFLNSFQNFRIAQLINTFPFKNLP